MAFHQTCSLLQTNLVFRRHFKVSIVLQVEMYQTDADGEVSRMECFPFRGDTFSVSLFTEYERDVSLAMGDIERTVGEFLYQGSGWRVLAPHFLDVFISECLPLEGGSNCGPHRASYEARKGLVVNYDAEKDPSFEQDDGTCLYNAIAQYFCPTGSSRQQIAEFAKARGYPAGRFVAVNNLDKVEQDQRWGKDLDFGVTVLYKDEDGSILPVRVTRILEPKHTIVLLLYHLNLKGGTVDKHYALIEDPDKVFRQRRKTERGQHYVRKSWMCYNCMNAQYSLEAHINHKHSCNKDAPGRVILPKPGECLSFSSSSYNDLDWPSFSDKTFNNAYMLCFDFETMPKKVQQECRCSETVLENTKRLRDAEKQWEGMTQEERGEMAVEGLMASVSSGEEEIQMSLSQASAIEEGEIDSRSLPKRRGKRAKKRKGGKRKKKIHICTCKTKTLYEHIPYMCSYILFDRERNVIQEETLIGLDCATKFVEVILSISRQIKKSLSPGTPMRLKPSERRLIMEGNVCYLCEKSIAFPYEKVIDHDHLTGKILGLSHSRCNLARRERHQLTCFAHNLSGFDSHILAYAMAEQKNFIKKSKPIPLNEQRFKAIPINSNIMILDSFAFLQGKLSKLAENLKLSGCRFGFMDDMVNNQQERDLLVRKGVFPYSFASSIKKMEETTSLPPLSAFKNDLDNTDISEEDYEHAQKVWATFRPRNLLEYALIYCKTDVRLLAEAIFDMRENIWKEFGLDLCSYLSLPMLTKDMMLKHTGVKIELIADQVMSKLLQANIRGGLSYINTRSAGRGALWEAEESVRGQQHIFYWDANNLYGLGRVATQSMYLSELPYLQILFFFYRYDISAASSRFPMDESRGN